MTAFHPAVYAVLHGALREHQESRSAAESVSGLYDTAAQVEYHDAIIESFDELLGVLYTGEADAAVDDRLIAEAGGQVCHGMMPDGTWTARCGAGDRVRISMLLSTVTCEACLQAYPVHGAAIQDGDTPPVPKGREHAAFGRMVPLLADVPTASWDVHDGELDIQLAAGRPDDQVRPHMSALAERLGFRYDEVEQRSHVSVEARAVVDGVDVRIWDHVKPTPVQDEDQPAATPPARGHGQDVVTHYTASPSATAVCGDDDGGVSPYAVDVTCSPCLTGLNAEALRQVGDHRLTGYTAEQIDGTACIWCGSDFAPGEHGIPLPGHVRVVVDGIGVQVFRHEHGRPDDEGQGR